MEIRLAVQKDLPKLKIMFDAIVANMDKQGINIWNEYFPYEEFFYDIKGKNLYLLTNQNEIVATFALFDNYAGEECFEWQDKNASAVYLGRVGVNVRYLRQGVGAEVIKQAMAIAKKRNVKYLRLLVVDVNIPAINLYLKQGFKQVKGMFVEFFEERNQTINELGFENPII